MYCQQYDDLENKLIHFRTQLAPLSGGRDLTPERRERVEQQEMAALFRFLEHTAEHGCGPQV